MSSHRPVAELTGHGVRVQLHEYQSRRGRWLFLVTSEASIPGGAVVRESSGFDDREEALAAMRSLAEGGRPERDVLAGGSSHARLENARSIRRPDVAPVGDVEQVWQEVETRPCSSCGYAVGADGVCRVCSGLLPV